jgi:hypothetical protein
MAMLDEEYGEEREQQDELGLGWMRTIACRMIERDDSNQEEQCLLVAMLIMC